MNVYSSYAAQQRDPRKHLIGLTAVVVFHAVLVYALANGLGRKVVDVLKAPLDVALIQELKAPPPPPPPPPPQKIVQAHPKVTAPPPAYVPPPDTPAPAAPAPLITTTATPTPPAPAAPPAPPAVAAPAAPLNAAVACPNYKSVPVDLPRQAEGIGGQVVVDFVVTPAGEIKDATVVRSTNSILNRPALNAVARFRCNGQDGDRRVRVPFTFSVDN